VLNGNFYPCLSDSPVKAEKKPAPQVTPDKMLHSPRIKKVLDFSPTSAEKLLLSTHAPSHANSSPLSVYSSMQVNLFSAPNSHNSFTRPLRPLPQLDFFSRGTRPREESVEEEEVKKKPKFNSPKK
jgi:hypothetical protein